MTNSRLQKNSNSTWRRRKCLKCQSIVTSIEEISLDSAIMVKKRGGDMEPFLRDKVYLSIYKAVDHKKNSKLIATALTQTVLRHLFKPSKGVSPVLNSCDVAKDINKVIKNYDAAASIKYLSFQSSLQLANDVRRVLK